MGENVWSKVDGHRTTEGKRLGLELDGLSNTDWTYRMVQTWRSFRQKVDGHKNKKWTVQSVVFWRSFGIDMEVFEMTPYHILEHFGKFEFFIFLNNFWIYLIRSDNHFWHFQSKNFFILSPANLMHEPFRYFNLGFISFIYRVLK